MPSKLRLRLLQVLLGLDAAVLLTLGAVFVLLPAKTGYYAFGFDDIPPPGAYLIAMWGCALISLGIGYGLSIFDPMRNVTWVQAGIIRGVMECGLGFTMMQQHLVNWKDARLGTVAAAIITAGYLALYPRQEK